ncbi:MAG: hypothetical protein MdMp014T_2620 [Treponematales bacterium]
MKKLALMALLVVITPHLRANDTVSVDFYPGNFGVGICSGDDDGTLELTASLLSLTLEQRGSRIGVEIHPAKFWNLQKLQDEPETVQDGEKFSFINMNAYWNIFDRSDVLLGPFVSINYLFVSLSSGLQPAEAVFTSGLRFSYRPARIKSKKRCQLVSAEIGYRNIQGGHKLYAGVNIDLLLGLYSIGLAETDRVREWAGETQVE